MSIHFNVYFFHWTGYLLIPLFMICGLILLYVSWRLLKAHLYRLRHWTRTVGVIVDHHIDVDVDVDLDFHDRDQDDRVEVRYSRKFKVEFWTITGHLVTFWSPFGSNYNWTRRGERINVLYDPADPESAEIAHGIYGGWSKVWFVALMGLMFVGTGIFFFI